MGLSHELQSFVMMVENRSNPAFHLKQVQAAASPPEMQTRLIDDNVRK
jgi:hypothetical protein